MNPLAIPELLALILNGTIAVFVYADNPGSINHRLFSLLVLCFAVWNLGECIFLNTSDPWLVYFGTRIGLFGLFMAPVCFLHFSARFPRARGGEKVPRWFLPFMYLIPAGLLAGWHIFLYQIDVGRFLEFKSLFGYAADCSLKLGYGLPFWVLSAVSLCYIGWGIRNLRVAVSHSVTLHEQLQIKYLIFGALLMIGAGVLFHLLNFFLGLGYPLLYSAGFFSILMSLFFAVAIVKYRLLDIHLIIRRGIIYSVLSGMVVVAYFFLVRHLGEAVLEASDRQESLLLESAVVVFLIFLFRPLERRVEHFIDRVLYPGSYRLRARFSRFARELLGYVKLEDLIEAGFEFIEESLAPERLAFFIQDAQGEGYSAAKFKGASPQPKLSKEDPLVRRMVEEKRSIELEPYPFSSPHPLSEAGFRWAVPLISDRLVGWIAFSLPERPQSVTTEVVELLEGMAGQLSLAISRVNLFETLRSREREVMQAEKMATLGGIAAGLIHEIKNPLGVISAAAQNLKELGSDSGHRSELADYIVEEAQRISNLLNHFLHFAKPRPPQIQRCNLNSILHDILALMEPDLRQRGVVVEKDLDPDGLLMGADPQQVEQAVLNLILNAADAMPQGGKIRISAGSTGANILLCIEDQGPGIPPEFRKKVFEPFFSTKKNGTGLGLSVAEQIVRNHNGEMEAYAASEGGAGFRLVFPVYGDNSRTQPETGEGESAYHPGGG
ncbi:MAG: ATP-binding protein [Desulfobacteraceae bacterium]